MESKTMFVKFSRLQRLVVI